jgi:hypothetical protein
MREPRDEQNKLINIERDRLHGTTASLLLQFGCAHH